MKDIKLNILNRIDEDDHDLLVEDFDLQIVDEVDAIKQNIRIRLWFFYREWFLDTSVGVRFYEDIKVKNPDLPDIEALLKAEISGTDGVNEILEFNMDFNRVTRLLSVTFKVNTTYGIIETTEVL